MFLQISIPPLVGTPTGLLVLINEKKGLLVRTPTTGTPITGTPITGTPITGTGISEL